MILVTGATGNVGRSLLPLLTAVADVRAVTRNPATATPLPGVTVVAGDPSRPDTLQPALNGVSAIFLNPAAVGASSPDLLRMAREHGVTRVVLLSAEVVRDAGPMQDGAIAREHKQIEDQIEASGLEWVFLRPTMFNTNMLHQWGPQIRASGVVHAAYAQATAAPVQEQDIAEVAVKALTTDALLGSRPVLTGPQSLTQFERVAIIGEVIGRPVRFQELSPAEARRTMVGRGFAATLADNVLAMLAESVGRPAQVSAAIEEILGRPAGSFAQWVDAHRDYFTRS